MKIDPIEENILQLPLAAVLQKYEVKILQIYLFPIFMKTVVERIIFLINLNFEKNESIWTNLPFLPYFHSIFTEKKNFNEFKPSCVRIFLELLCV